MIEACPACASHNLQTFLEVSDVPIQQNTPKATRAVALATPRGDIVLAWCPQCGFVMNTAFDPTLDIYTADYNNAQSYSPLFQRYVDGIASMLVERYDLHNKRIIEIGHGKGDFLIQLCEKGQNTGVGYDPSYVGGLSALDGRVRFVADFYGEKYAHENADLFVARHLIEHVPNLNELVGGIRRAIGEHTKTAVFFETPDVRWILQNGIFWDIFYEHCSLFSPGSIARLFARHGFNVSRVAPAFGGQYMWMEATPTTGYGDVPAGLDEPDLMGKLVEHFKTHYHQKLETVQEHLRCLRADGRRAVVWGAGAKGVTLLNTVKAGFDVVPVVVDVNPDKHQRYVPGTGHLIVAPEQLVTYVPEVVFIMNPNYEAEIKHMLSEMGLTVQIVIL